MSETQPEDPRVGTTVGGRYRLTQRLASGGMGVVYRGERVQLGRAVAVKFLHYAFAARPDILHRFETEVRAMSRLAHPHCVSVIDYGVEEGAPYVVMDFVHGKTLRALLDEGRVPTGRALHIARHVLGGLAHAHGQGIIHRDIKPANIMLTEATGTGDHVRILDFGLAKLRDAGMSGDASQASLAVGTPSYMPPEQARGDKVDARSDIYSVGVMVFELLTGKKPFESDQAFEVISMHASAPPPRLREAAPASGFSRELEGVILKAMAKDPADRFASAAEFTEALDATPEATLSRSGRAGSAGIAEANRRLALTETRAISTSEERSAAGRGRARGAAGDEAARSRVGAGIGGLFRGLFTVAVVAALGYGGLVAYRKYLAPRRTETLSVTAQVAVQGSAGATAGAAAPGAPLPSPAPPPPSSPASGTASAAVAPPPAPPAGVPAPPVSPGGVPVATAPVPPRAVPVPAPPPLPPAPPPEAAGSEDLPAAERAEPVREVKNDPERDEDIDDARASGPMAPAAAGAARVDNVSDVQALIGAGHREEAIAGLLKLRKQSPKSAYIPYLLGGLYFEKMWWTDGIAAYGVAIDNNPAYRRREVLIRNTIRALSSDKTAKKAAILLREVGPAATPYLRQAAKSDANGNVRARANLLLKSGGRLR
jgi:eukaryotic-like serine/threonine-protein kinase